MVWSLIGDSVSGIPTPFSDHPIIFNFPFLPFRRLGTFQVFGRPHQQLDRSSEHGTPPNRISGRRQADGAPMADLRRASLVNGQLARPDTDLLDILSATTGEFAVQEESARDDAIRLKTEALERWTAIANRPQGISCLRSARAIAPKPVLTRHFPPRIPRARLQSPIQQSMISQAASKSSRAKSIVFTSLFTRDRPFSLGDAPHFFGNARTAIAGSALPICRLEPSGRRWIEDTCHSLWAVHAS